MTTVDQNNADQDGPGPLEPIATNLEPKGAPRAPISAVLFDVYGTLFISASGDIGQTGNGDQLMAAIDRVRATFGIDRSAQVLWAGFKNEIKSTHARMKKTGRDFPEVDIERVWRTVLKEVDGFSEPEHIRIFARAFETATNPVWPMPNAAWLLAAVAEKQLAAGIISNAQFYTNMIFEQFLGQKPTESWADPSLIFYSYLYGYAKPSLYLFERAVEALDKKGIAPENTLYVGNDMLNDIYPAQACGFQTALFAGDARSLRLREDDSRCALLSPDLIITDLAQLEAQL